MKKNKNNVKKKLITCAMMIALCAAVWLNVRFSSTGGAATSSVPDSKLGSAKYVANTSVVSQSEDFFTKTKNDRAEAREEQLDAIKDTLNSQKSTEKQKAAAEQQVKKITARIESESAIEALLAAKEFKKSAVILGDDNASVIVKKSGELEKSETVQILDIVTGETGLSAEKIKIVTVK